MIVDLTGTFLGVTEVQLRDKPPMRLVELLQSTESGHDLIKIPVSDTFKVPEVNKPFTCKVRVSAFIGKDKTAKVGVRMV